ncbi:hypothetical protein [Azospirillum aestuarii]|uniref:hypothetical protein n=1 Tax=Azospirillum aestuarii TaxID=2802052 RepID=UPI004054AC4D
MLRNTRTAFCAAIGVALSLFVCHKTVFAAPIASTDPSACSVVVTLPTGEHHSIIVPSRFFAEPENQPTAGDYLVIYRPDGYKSWSPKDVFEQGYRLVESGDEGDMVTTAIGNATAQGDGDAPPTVTAKLRCHYIQTSDTCRTVHLHPVYDNDPSGPNAAWSKATPSRQVSLSITNPAAYERFEEGKEYMVTFTPVT